MEKVERGKIHLNLPMDFINRIDDYAKKMSITRTSAIIVLCNQALDYAEVVNSIPTLLEMNAKLEKK